MSNHSGAKKGILYLAFNQDNSCISIGDYKGIKIYTLEAHKVCYSSDMGAISIAEMLFCTSLTAFVGAGEQPTLTPRKLTLLNTTTQNVIQDLSFQTSVLAVRMNRKRLVVVLERQTYIHALETLELLRTLETAANPKGRCALAPSSEQSLLALPASSTSGTLRIYDTLDDGGNVLCEISAHKAPVATLAWSQDGTLLASASQKGTVLRVHKMPQASKIYTFRRGTSQAPIHCLAFSPPGMHPPLLCAASGHGTVHIFRLEEPDRHPAAVAASGFLSAVMPVTVADVVDPPRCIATIRLPAGIPAICALHAAAQDANGNVMPVSTDKAFGEAANVTVVVATLDGILYEYCLWDLRAAQGPTCSLEGEWFLLGHPAT